ncbi:M81 family metallopeptidase [Curvivirga aplysinae]|uniref:M81 family metallopeptidase n=1 Tax=Curvivirga aplysinae TaxID=2529852 RepID=UPI0012BC6933|nr:M81 family metallopeptidase [Curvivirga aplysinae]MTI10042.1 M81 family peptidase [Curvivirga aplysinae]
MATIAVGGFQHETNTFAPVKASFDKFEQADGWPRLCRGADLIKETKGVHLPLTGAMDTLTTYGYDLFPLSWCSATPSAHVTEGAFERISGQIIEDIEKAMKRPGGLDGVYLDLHGAMVCEHTEDGEGEILRRVRDVVGEDMPIAVSLDLHANVTDLMVEKASVIEIYRTYPHVDMGETGARAARHLHSLLNTGEKWAKAHIKPDFLVPLVFGCTYLPAPSEMYNVVLPELLESDPSVAALSFACGFNLADIKECGPSIIAYAETQEDADRVAKALSDALDERRNGFGGKIFTPDEVVAEAQRIAASADKPVIIADTQDNPGGGGPGDTTGLLRAFVSNKASNTLVGIFNDPAAALKCHEAGIGAEIELSIGGKLQPEDEPFICKVKVLSLGDGVFTGIGPMWGGANFQMGNMALVELESGVRVAIMSKPMQTGDTSMLRHLDIEPENEKIIAVKSSVHFRADFQPIASEVLVVAAEPGPVRADANSLNYKNLRSGVSKTP